MRKMNRRSFRLRRNAKLFSSLLLSCALGMAAPSVGFCDGNPDIVGVLASLTDSNTAADLGLSDEQLAKLKDLVKQHEAKAIDFAAELRSIEDPIQRKERSRQNLRAVEVAGMAMLNEQQRQRAEQLRLQGLGLAAALEPEIATALSITEEQQAKIQTIVEGKRGLMRQLGPEKGAVEFAKQLGDLMNDEQKAKWAEMTGPVAGKPQAQDDSSSTSSPGESTGAASTASMPRREPTSDSVPSGIPGEFGLRLNFNSTPWSDVLKWLAKEAELSLQTDFFPPGTFTYRDPYRVYTVAQAMDIMNGVLLNRGYTLVRKQRALLCIDLGSGDAETIRGYIREVSEFIPVKELDNRGEYEICKTVFMLSRLSVEEAEKEVKPLLGPQGSIVALPSANQLIVTETGGKLRLIRETIERSEMPDAGRMSKIVSIALKNMSSEELLAIARPLVGLKDGTNVSDELSISTDSFGTTLYATGTAEKLQKLRDIVTQVDVEPMDGKSASTTAEQVAVRSHNIRGSDPQTTMDVLQTQFSGQTNINLALDPKSNNIIARATPSDHKIIEEIIETLSGQTSDFEVIDLGKMDTQAAILTLEKFFGKSSSKDKDGNAKGPIFYGDTIARRIMVQGTPQEVSQVRELLKKVEATGPTLEGLREKARFIPYSGKSADKFLSQIDVLWQATKQNGRIRRIESRGGAQAPSESPAEAPSNQQSQPAPSTEKTPGQKAAASEPAKFPFPANNLSVAGVRLTKAVQEVASQDPSSPSDQPAKQATQEATNELRVFQGPAGLIVTSDDPQLLNEFDEISRVVQEQMAAGPSEPTVIYLKHISALAAEELIRGVLNGASSGGGGGGGGGGLLGEVAGSVLGGGGFLGSLLGMGGGSGGSAASSTMTASGDVSITADPRLNALWVQANPLDMQLIEELIQIIDTDNSPVDPQTRGTPNIIYLQSASVTEVEATVRSVFADRLGGAAGAQNAQRPPSPQEFIEALRGGGGGGRRGSAPKELKEATMTITSDKKNNSLIVVAPKQLFEQVEEFVTMLDKTAEGSEDSFIVAPIAGVNPNTVRSALSSVFGAQARVSSTSNPQTTGQPSNSTQQQGNALQQLRNQFQGALGGGNQGRTGVQMGFPGGFPGAGGQGGNPGMMFGIPGGMGGQGGGQGGFRGMQGGGANPFGGGMGGATGGFGGNRGGFGTGGGNTGGGNRGNRGNR
jgi:type II secretory pathway component GspD/PulD (secretin)